MDKMQHNWRMNTLNHTPVKVFKYLQILFFSVTGTFKFLWAKSVVNCQPGIGTILQQMVLGKKKKKSIIPRHPIKGCGIWSFAHTVHSLGPSLWPVITYHVCVDLEGDVRVIFTCVEPQSRDIDGLQNKNLSVSRKSTKLLYCAVYTKNV